MKYSYEIDMQDPLEWRKLIENIVLDALYQGNVVVTVELEPQQPLAMGNYKPRVDVRPVRHSAEPEIAPSFHEFVREFALLMGTRTFDQNDATAVMQRHGCSNLASLVLDANAHMRAPILRDLRALVAGDDKCVN